MLLYVMAGILAATLDHKEESYLQIEGHIHLPARIMSTLFYASSLYICMTGKEHFQNII